MVGAVVLSFVIMGALGGGGTPPSTTTQSQPAAQSSTSPASNPATQPAPQAPKPKQAAPAPKPVQPETFKVGQAAKDENFTFTVTKVKPGNSVDAIVVFDIPKASALATVTLKESILTEAVTVTVK